MDRFHFTIRVDATGEYTANLEWFLRALPWENAISVGQPKQNPDYSDVHFYKRKADPVESLACARLAIVSVRHPRLGRASICRVS
jgi:hypothetical protein